VASNLTQGATAGQLLAQGNGAYLIQQGVDPDAAHTLIAAQRASPQTVTAVSQHVSFKPDSTVVEMSVTCLHSINVSLSPT
jgi:hypothetical protein